MGLASNLEVLLLLVFAEKLSEMAIMELSYDCFLFLILERLIVEILCHSNEVAILID